MSKGGTHVIQDIHNTQILLIKSIKTKSVLKSVCQRHILQTLQRSNQIVKLVQETDYSSGATNFATDHPQLASCLNYA